MKNYEDMGKEAEQVKDTDIENAGVKPVNARVVKTRRAVYSIRLASSELTTITQAARAKGMGNSEFIRAAALAAAAEELDSGHREAPLYDVTGLGSLPGI